jgi:hypothetical protein
VTAAVDPIERVKRSFVLGRPQSPDLRHGIRRGLATYDQERLVRNPRLGTGYTLLYLREPPVLQKGISESSRLGAIIATSVLGYVCILTFVYNIYS